MCALFGQTYACFPYCFCASFPYLYWTINVSCENCRFQMAALPVNQVPPFSVAQWPHWQNDCKYKTIALDMSWPLVFVEYQVLVSRTGCCGISLSASRVLHPLSNCGSLLWSDWSGIGCVSTRMYVLIVLLPFFFELLYMYSAVNRIVSVSFHYKLLWAKVDF